MYVLTEPSRHFDMLFSMDYSSGYLVVNRKLVGILHLRPACRLGHGVGKMK